MSSNKMKKESFCKKCSITEVAWGIFKIVSFKRRLSKLIIIFTRNFQTVWRLNMMTYGLNYKISRMVLKYSIRLKPEQTLINSWTSWKKFRKQDVINVGCLKTRCTRMPAVWKKLMEQQILRQNVDK